MAAAKPRKISSNQAGLPSCESQTLPLPFCLQGISGRHSSNVGAASQARAELGKWSESEILVHACGFGEAGSQRHISFRTDPRFCTFPCQARHSRRCDDAKIVRIRWNPI